MNEKLKIAELLCTRLCHDLTGPIGAVNNGAEFLQEEGFNMQSQAVELITSSAQEAVSRLQFYRMAYGRINDQGEACLADKKKLVTDFFSGTKVVVDWPDSHTDAAGISVGVRMARLLLNMVIIASSVLMKGGTISVRLNGTAEGKKEVRVSANGSNVKWDKEWTEVLQSGVDMARLTPKNVQLYLTRLLAEELEAKLTFHAGEDSFEIAAQQVTGPMF